MFYVLCLVSCVLCLVSCVLCFLSVRLSHFSLAAHWVLPSLKICFDPVIQPEQSSGPNDTGMSDYSYQTVGKFPVNYR